MGTGGTLGAPRSMWAPEGAAVRGAHSSAGGVTAVVRGWGNPSINFKGPQ